MNHKIICLMHKHQFGNLLKPISVEYKGFYKNLKKLNKQTFFFETHNYKLGIYRNNLKIIEFVKKIKPNIIFCHQSSYEIYSETFQIIKKICNPIIINWCSDDSWRYEQHSKLILKNFDIMITTHYPSYLKYLKRNKKVLFESWGYPDQWVSRKKKNKFIYDVSFIGSAYMGRDLIIKSLKEYGYNVNCFGSGWKKKINEENFTKIIKCSKINLNFSKSRGGENQTKARIFEITGSGGFCLTETSNDISRFFKIKKEIDVFTDLKDLNNKINFYLNNDTVRNNIAHNGYKKCIKYFTYTKILKRIFKKINFRNNNNSKIYTNNINLPNPKKNVLLRIYKIITVFFFSIFFTKSNALKYSRRLMFEIEWRINKEKTYSLSGWCNRLFDYN